MTKQPVAYPKVTSHRQYDIHVKLFWFTKRGNVMVDEENIDQLTLQDLQDIFDIYIDNDIYNVWQVNTRHARNLQKITQHNIAIDRYYYFVEQQAIQD